MSEYPFNGAVDTEFTADGPLATAARQTEGNVSLAALLAELGQKLEPADIAALATAAKQDAVLAQIIAASAQAATEATLAAMEASAKRQAVLLPPRALQYARDAGDRMRVTLEGSPVVPGVGANVNNGAVSLFSGNSNVPTTYYGTGGPNSMDTRELHQELCMQTFQAKRSKWAFT